MILSEATEAVQCKGEKMAIALMFPGVIFVFVIFTVKLNAYNVISVCSGSAPVCIPKQAEWNNIVLGCCVSDLQPHNMHHQESQTLLCFLTGIATCSLICWPQSHQPRKTDRLTLPDE